MRSRTAFRGVRPPHRRRPTPAVCARPGAQHALTACRAALLRPLPAIEHFQFEMLCISNHTACRFAEKAWFFRSLWAGRRSVAASCCTFFKDKTLWRAQGRKPAPRPGPNRVVFWPIRAARPGERVVQRPRRKLAGSARPRPRRKQGYLERRATSSNRGLTNSSP